MRASDSSHGFHGVFLVPKPIWGTSLPPRQKGPRVGDALHLEERNFVETVRWTFPKVFRCFWCFFKQITSSGSKSEIRAKGNEEQTWFSLHLSTNKALQVGKSNIPIHVSIWFFRLFPTWRVVPNTYFGWGLGEVQRRTSRKEKPLLQSPKGLLVKLLIPFSISSPKKDHF